MKHFVVNETDFNNLGWAKPISRNIQEDKADFGSVGAIKWNYRMNGIADSLQTQLDTITSKEPVSVPVNKYIIYVAGGLALLAVLALAMRKKA